MVSVFILSVMFMNFMIAVVSDSYAAVMASVAPLSYKLKAQMIAERESLMSIEELKNPVLNPRYLILRLVEGGDSELRGER